MAWCKWFKREKNPDGLTAWERADRSRKKRALDNPSLEARAYFRNLGFDPDTVPVDQIQLRAKLIELKRARRAMKKELYEAIKEAEHVEGKDGEGTR